MLLLLTGVLPAAICASDELNHARECGSVLLMIGVIGTTIFIAAKNLANMFWSLEPSHPANWGVYWVLILPQVGVGMRS